MKLYTHVIDNYGKEVLELGLGLVIQECDNLICPAYKEENPTHYNFLVRQRDEARAVKKEMETLKPIRKDIIV